MTCRARSNCWVTSCSVNFFTASGGKLSLELGWTPFFLLTTIITIPALVMLHWIGKRWPKGAGES